MKSVLLVDDDDIFNFVSKKMLQHMGIAKDIHMALNGQEALDLFNGYFLGTTALPDVILLDLNMPIMDGFEFLEALKRLPLPTIDKVKIIIVSSSQNPKDIERAKKLGIREYLTKPFTKETLLKALEG